MRRWVAGLALAIVTAAAIWGWTGRGGPQVTVYTSVDQVYAEPILRAFTAETGIAVNALYDAEASKTVGLVNRLVAEREAPLADVFWNGEFMQTLALAGDGLLAPYTPPGAALRDPLLRDPGGLWSAFGGRARVLIVNTALLPAADRPARLADLVARAPDLAFANPLFGSAATHVAALAAAMGEDAALDLIGALQAGGAAVVDGNAVVRDMVADGRRPMGLTDTDDACVAIMGGAPVDVVFLDQAEGGLGTLVIPNTVALIAGAPHPDTARRLIDYLLSPDTEAALVASGWVQIPSIAVAATPRCYGGLSVRPMQVPMAAIREAGATTADRLRAMFQN